MSVDLVELLHSSFDCPLNERLKKSKWDLDSHFSELTISKNSSEVKLLFFFRDILNSLRCHFRGKFLWRDFPDWSCNLSLNVRVLFLIQVFEQLFFFFISS